MMNIRFTSVQPNLVNQNANTVRKEMMRIHLKVSEGKDLTPTEKAEFTRFIEDKLANNKRLTTTESSFINKKLP